MQEGYIDKDTPNAAKTAKHKLRHRSNIGQQRIESADESTDLTNNPPLLYTPFCWLVRLFSLEQTAAGSNVSVQALWPSGKAKLCKSFIHQFESGQRLQTFYPLFIEP